MKKIAIILVILCSFINIYGQKECCYSSKFLKLYSTNSSLYFVQTRNSEQMMKIKDMVSRSNDGEKIIASLAENAIIVNSKSLGVGNYVSDIYQDKEGLKLIMLPRFAIKMKDGHDIEEVLTLYGQCLSYDKKEINVYMVDCNADNAEDVLAINTEINLLEAVEWCEPMMIGEARKCNQYAGYQYYIKNTGQNGGTSGIDINVEPVWNILSGNTSLIVAVLDDGVERDHEDLSGSVLNGKTLYYPNEYGDPIYEYYDDEKAHGTACAGIIAAKNNTVGIRGVASGVRILPINIYPYPYTTDLFPNNWYEKIGEAITWAYDTKGADVISCSNHFSDNNYYIANALNNAMTYGRNGKGSVVVCSAGNSGSDVKFPANMSGTIAVGAVNNTGTVWGYSCRGESLDLVAPSGDGNSTSDIITTDRMGDYGYNTSTNNINEIANTNYTQRFGGTSAACPQVAGVAALMLSANPNLTTSQVKSILQKKARKLPEMNGQNRTDAYGYGLVDAYAAVDSVISAALNSTFEIEGPQLIYNYGQYRINNLPSGVTVTWSVSNSYYNNYPYLISNFPALGWCLIFRDEDHDMINGTLTAEIKYKGVTIQTLTKTIHAYDDFWGQYTSGNLSGEINYTHTFGVKGNYATTVTSPNFYGATVTYDSSGATPTAWSFDSSLGRLNFVAPASPPGNSIPVVINVHDGCGNDYDLYAFASTANSINVSYEENGISVTMVEDGDIDRGSTFDQSWTIEVCNATTGALMATRSSTSRSEIISTTGWPKGIYIVKVIIGEEILTEKVIVR